MRIMGEQLQGGTAACLTCHAMCRCHCRAVLCSHANDGIMRRGLPLMQLASPMSGVKKPADGADRLGHGAWRARLPSARS